MNKFFAKIPYKEFLVGVFIINFICIGIVFLVMANLPPVVPLLYGLPYGEGQLVGKWLLFIPLGISQIIVIINTVIIRFTDDNFSQQAMLYTTLATSILSIVTVTKIVFLIGSL